MSRQPLRQPWLLSRLLHECAVTMGMALECLSITAYNSHLNSYLMFCHIHNCPIYPSVDTLSFFVVFMSAHICLDSVAVYLTGVCNHLAHEFPKVHQHCASPIVKHTLAGCLWCAHQQPICRPPVALTHIHDAVHAATLDSSHDDLLFTTLLATGFHMLMCLSELVWPNSIQLQSHRKVILCHSFICDNDSYCFTLPTYKTIKAGHRDEVLVCSFTATADPLPIMQCYVCSHDTLSYYSSKLWLTSEALIPTCSWFMHCLWNACGSKFTGNSMQACGATALAL